MNFSKYRSSQFSKCFELLPSSDRRKLIVVLGIQVLNGLLDLLGVALIGILGALSITGIQSGTPSGKVAQIIEIMGISELKFQAQAAVIGLCATLIFLIRTGISIFFTRKALYFLSRRAAAITSDLTYKLLNQSILEIRLRSNQATVYALTNGVAILTVGVIGTTLTIFSDVTVLLVISVGLFFIDPTIAVGVFVFFTALALLMYRLMSVRARRLGLENARYSVLSTELIDEVLGSYREIQVRGRRSYYGERVKSARFELADTLAEMQFLPNISKYIIESSVLIGTISVAAIQFMTKDSVHAVATLSVFLAAGTRITPAILRVQQGAVQVKSNLGAAEPTFEVIQSLVSTIKSAPQGKISDFKHLTLNPKVVVNDVSYRYPTADFYAISGANLEINPGEVVALVGPSGAGKSTLADLMLGVLDPIEGDISISGQPPKSAIETWNGGLAYVPQDVFIVNKSIKENIAIGYPTSEIDDSRVKECLELAQLTDYVKSLADGIETLAGERGSILSGGQRQRLGIARALYTNPKFIILDEATSALDGVTERAVASAILGLKGKVTLVIIAHRLSTVLDADQVVYIESGRILAVGSFTEVRNQISNFDQQAQLMGL